MLQRGVCKSCRTPIYWARTRMGKPIPLDTVQHAGGNIEIADGIAQVVKPDAAVIRYRSHFASCVYAQQHRSAR